MPPVNRVTFLIDGFNLYHSVEDASYHLGLKGTQTKWLDIDSMCRSYLPTIRAATVPTDATQLEAIYYFSAFASHMNRTKPDAVKRHKSFMECLKSTNIQVSLGLFKKKKRTCRSCGSIEPQHEEKETDVAIATKLLELLFIDASDTVVLVSGDTDLAPPVRTAQKLFPHKEVFFAFPFHRMNNALKILAPKSFQITRNSYVTHQFPNVVTLAGGTNITKPANW